MNKVLEHYDNFLADIYCWMSGGFNENISYYDWLFEQLGIYPKGSFLAVDLGAGCGFQSIPLAKLGFKVLSFDTSKLLITQLQKNKGALDITPYQTDLRNFRGALKQPVELVTCMTDTILLLDNLEDVIQLLEDTYSSLEYGGRFILSFRDFSEPLVGVDRFIPVKNDSTKIFTCALDYEDKTVSVTDLLYYKEGTNWKLKKSSYNKLRLSASWFKNQIIATGFNERDVRVVSDKGFITITCYK